ncbi:MAG: YjbH domain-containing protein [Armatimonadota bacterium]
MKTLLAVYMMCIVALCLGTSAHAADALPPVVTGPQVDQYKVAMTKTLAGLKVTLREAVMRGSTLQVSYEDTNEKESHAFILAAVLTLAAPLATGGEDLCVRSFDGTRKLSEITVAPEDVRSIYGAELKQGEEARLESLLAGVLRRARITPAAVAVTPPTVTVVPVAPVVNAVAAPPKPVPAVVAANEQQPLADKLLAELRQAKLENVTVAVDQSGGWVVGFENRSYRSDLEALAVALRLMAVTLPPVQLAVSVKRDEVAVCQVSLYLGDYLAAQGDTLTPDELAQRWQVRSGEASGPPQTLAAGNSSRGRVDVALRPALRYELGGEADPFQGDALLVANADTTLGRGWHANLQSTTRLSSGVTSSLDRILLTKTTWVGRDLLATGSFGKFEDAFSGWYGELQWEQQQHRLGLIGNDVGKSLRLGSNGRRQVLGYYEYEAGRLGLTARVGYGRFVDSNTSGALVSLQRRFGESVVVAEAIRGEGGAQALNFRLSLPLGPRVASSPSALRLRSDRALKLDYESNLALQGNYLQKGQDLGSFRGELSASYVGQQADRMLGKKQETVASRWPASPSLEGNSGLIRIPTADVMSDGSFVAGISYMDKEHARVLTGPTDAMPMFLGIGLLPDLELVGKLTIYHDQKAFNWNYNMDRAFNAHYRVLRQKRNLPALAVGIQDVMYGTTSTWAGKSKYIVGTWAAQRYRLHLGLGQDKLEGVFGGLDYALRPDHRLQLLLDYDTAFVNAGLRGFVNKWLTVDVSLLGLSDLGGAVVFQTELQ